MRVDVAYAIVMAVLLISNMWLLREVDVLRRQLEAYQREVAALDDRVCQLMYAVEEFDRGRPEEPFARDRRPAAATPARTG